MKHVSESTVKDARDKENENRFGLCVRVRNFFGKSREASTIDDYQIKLEVLDGKITGV